MSPPLLKIATIKAVSLVDEPNKAVSVVHMQGCNFNCKFCHSSSLIPMDAPGTFNISLDEFVKEVSEVFLIDGVVFTGGEPLLQTNVTHFLKAVKDRYEVAAIDTNGSVPGMLQVVSEMASRVAMDLKAPLEKYPAVVNRDVRISKIQESINILCERSRNLGRVEFRITYVPPVLSIEDIFIIGDYLQSCGFSDMLGSNLVLQQYVPSKGVRGEYKNEFKAVPHEDLAEIARGVADCGIPVAIRSREKGYVKIA